MPKYRILAPIVFDGVTFPAGTIVDASAVPISGECLVLRSWGEPYHGDLPAITSVEQLRQPEPIPEPGESPHGLTDPSDPTDLVQPDPEPAPEPLDAPVYPSVEPATQAEPAPKPKRSRKAK